MGSDQTDEELMLAYAGGDLLAFEMLYRRRRRRAVPGHMEPAHLGARALSAGSEVHDLVAADRAQSHRRPLPAPSPGSLGRGNRNRVPQSRRTRKRSAGPRADRIRAAATPAARARGTAGRTARDIPAARRERPRSGGNRGDHGCRPRDGEIASALCAGTHPREVRDMNIRDPDRDVDDLLGDDGGEMGKLYRRLPRYEPPRRLDRAVLGEAARAVHSGKPPRRQRWVVGLGSAAGLVLAAGIAWRVGHDVMYQNESVSPTAAPRVVPVEPISEPARAKREDKSAQKAESRESDAARAEPAPAENAAGRLAPADELKPTPR